MSAAVLALALVVVFVILRASRRYIWRPEREDDAGAPDFQYDLVADNPESRTIGRFLGLAAVVSLAGAAALFAFVSPFQAVTPVAVVCPLALLGSWQFSRFFRGTAEIRGRGITIRAGRTVILAWEYVQSIEVTTFRRTRGSDARFAALMHAGVDVPFVRVTLTHGMRFNTFGGLSGPGVDGFPTTIRQCRIWVADPEKFVERVQPYLCARWLPGRERVAAPSSV